MSNRYLAVSSMWSSSSEFDFENPHLFGVFGKMNRAVDHIKELDKWFKEWLDTQPWSIETETDADGVAKRLYFEITNPIPTWTMLAAGDAIHNLRSALDHLAAAQAVSLGKSVKEVWFPIASSEAGYPDLADKRLRKCSKGFRDFVADFQPYPGGNDLLYALHQLDIIDKHRVLIPIGAGSSITIDADAGLYGVIDFTKTDRPVKIPIHGGKKFLENGDTVIEFSEAFWFPEKTEIRTEASVSVVFNEATPLPGVEIRSALRDMLSAVEDIIVAAEPRFFR